MKRAFDSIHLSPRKLLILAAAAGFLLGLSVTTNYFYRSTDDSPVINPENIITGNSQAPNQYRVLTPLLYQSLKQTFVSNSLSADHLVMFFSIILCYLAAGLLFYKSSGSLPLTMLALLALLGAFVFGMVYKYRQEFFETAFVTLSLLTLVSVRKIKPMYLILFLLAIVSSLNRETYIFCLIGITVHIAAQHCKAGQYKSLLPHVFPLLALMMTYAAIMAALRWYFGLSIYHGEFWMYTKNFMSMLEPMSPHNIAFLGAGVLFAWLTTVLMGNRQYLAFVLGYSLPLMVTSFFISSFTEHRVFYPMMAIMIASMLSFIRQQYQRRDGV